MILLWPRKKILKLKKRRNMENTINNISQSDRKPSQQASQCPCQDHLRPGVVSRAFVAPWSRSCRQGLWVVERPRLSVRSCPLWCSSFDSRDAQDAACLYNGRQTQSTKCRLTRYHSYTNQNLIDNLHWLTNSTFIIIKTIFKENTSPWMSINHELRGTYVILRRLQAEYFPLRWFCTTTNSTSSPVCTSIPSWTSVMWKNNFFPSSAS